MDRYSGAEGLKPGPSWDKHGVYMIRILLWLAYPDSEEVEETCVAEDCLLIDRAELSDGAGWRSPLP